MAKFNINAMFTNGSDELNLYSTSIDEDSDSIKIITNVRQPALKRGSVGDLIFVSKATVDGTEIRDTHKDMLLQRIEVWSEEIDEATEWRYVFLKD